MPVLILCAAAAAVGALSYAGARRPDRFGRWARLVQWAVVALLAFAAARRVLEASWGWAALDVACAAGFGHSLATNGGTR